jgi:isocitrate/isopropylmalate dehydrogenase
VIRLAVLPGDGVGPEVMEGPTELLRKLASQKRLELTGPWPIGASSYASTGEGLPDETLRACEEADAIFLGAVGEYPGFSAEHYRTEESLLRLRVHFDFSISVRQVWRGDDPPLTIVRNLLDGAYGGADIRQESDGEQPASDLFRLTPQHIEAIVNVAMRYVDDKCGLWSVDKANLLATSRLWRKVVKRVASRKGVDCRHVYIDRCAYELARYDLPDAVIVTEGLFGDILSDLAAGRAGSIAFCSSASIHPGEPAKGRCVGLFEPIHGSAPRMVGTNTANPTGAYLALIAALEWFPDTIDLAGTLRRALAEALSAEPKTKDIASEREPFIATKPFAERVNACFEKLAHDREKKVDAQP